MSIQQGLTTSFRQGMLEGQQNLTTDVLKIALYTGMATIGLGTTEYTLANEVVGTGYTAGGNIVTNLTVSAATNGVLYVSFDNPEWLAATFTTRGALIYNTTQANASIAVIDFGADKTCANQTFTITLPANTATNALLRFI